MGNEKYTAYELIDLYEQKRDYNTYRFVRNELCSIVWKGDDEQITHISKNWRSTSVLKEIVQFADKKHSDYLVRNCENIKVLQLIAEVGTDEQRDYLVKNCYHPDVLKIVACYGNDVHREYLLHNCTDKVVLSCVASWGTNEQRDYLIEHSDADLVLKTIAYKGSIEQIFKLLNSENSGVSKVARDTLYDFIRRRRMDAIDYLIANTRDFGIIYNIIDNTTKYYDYVLENFNDLDLWHVIACYGSPEHKHYIIKHCTDLDIIKTISRTGNLQHVAALVNSANPDFQNIGIDALCWRAETFGANYRNRLIFDTQHIKVLETIAKCGTEEQKQKVQEIIQSRQA